MIKRLLSSLFLVSLFQITLQAQHISGVVKDAETGETLVMANVLGPNRSGTVTEANGKFYLEVPVGEVEITFSFVGYDTQKQIFNVPETGMEGIEIILKPVNEVLETVVITAGKFEQKVEETTVSLEVIKPNLIIEKNTIQLQEAFNQTPGVIVTDDQANIRSGSGWSFGAGTRVLLLVDDMPLISPDAGQIQWKFLPQEALLQMEVIKGASSALFGTSAMNGIINVRTVTPKSKPHTEVMLFGGFYDKPARSSLKWWNGTQTLGGVTFLHARKIKNMDLTVSGIVSRDPGFRKGEPDHRNRLSVKTTFYPKNIKGMTWGIDGSFMYTEHGDALLWQDFDSAYVARKNDPTMGNSWDYYVDPHLSYRHGRSKHSIRGRIMGLNNTTSSKETNYENFSTYYYGEYQFQHFFSNDLWITTGAVGALGYSNSEVFSGYHETENGAAFLQIDKKWKRLSVSGGIRYEAYRLDERVFSSPVVRAGVNYKVGQATFIRASYGGGYRFPSMAEVFTYTDVGGTGVMPNPELNPESGWSTEIGIKQGFRLTDEWKGFVDVAGFINHFDDMTEFSFGLWDDPYDGTQKIAFKSINVGPTRITGFEFSLTGAGKVGPVDLRFFGGYTYMNPLALEPEFIYAETDNGTDLTYQSTSSDSTNNILKYRYQHLLRFDTQFEWKGIGLGFSVRYNDFMQNIDKIFEQEIFGIELFPGVKQSRETLNNGDLVFDMRAYYDFLNRWRVSFIVDNLTNREFSPRPSQLGPPRKFTVQVRYTL